jgi:hypothetical protein
MYRLRQTTLADQIISRPDRGQAAFSKKNIAG